MKKFNFKSIVFAAAALFLISSCYYDNEEELYPGTGPGTGNCDTANVSFSQHVNPLIQTKCAISGCHLNAQSPFFTSYSAIQSNKDKIRQRVVTSKDMPPPSSGITMSDAERNLINDWICQGALNN